MTTGQLQVRSAFYNLAIFFSPFAPAPAPDPAPAPAPAQSAGDTGCYEAGSPLLSPPACGLPPLSVPSHSTRQKHVPHPLVTKPYQSPTDL